MFPIITHLITCIVTRLAFQYSVLRFPHADQILPRPDTKMSGPIYVALLSYPRVEVSIVAEGVTLVMKSTAVPLQTVLARPFWRTPLGMQSAVIVYIDFAVFVCRWALVAQSIQQLATGWTVRGSKPGRGEIFCTRSYHSWCSSSLPYNGYRVSSPGVKRPGCGFNNTPHLTPRLKKE